MVDCTKGEAKLVFLHNFPIAKPDCKPIAVAFLNVVGEAFERGFSNTRFQQGELIACRLCGFSCGLVENGDVGMFEGGAKVISFLPDVG